MNNGDITKKILKAAKNKPVGPELEKEFMMHMNSFPLSSHKLVYNSDKSKMSPEAWDLLIKVSIESDKKKLEKLNDWMASMGMKDGFKSEFGRYSNDPEDA